MNTHSYKMVGAFLGILCLGLPVSAQEISPGKHYLPVDFKSKVQFGQFTLTPTQPQGSFLIEANQAPLKPVLQAIAQLADRKLVISDEAEEKLQKITVSIRVSTPEPMSAEHLFAWLSDNSFSYGKVGQDTYLLVPRKKSAVEVAAEEANRANAKENPSIPRPQKQVPGEAQEVHRQNPFRLLWLKAQQNK